MYFSAKAKISRAIVAENNIVLKEDEKMLVPIILSQQREVTEKLVDFKILLEKAEEQLNGKM